MPINKSQPLRVLYSFPHRIGAGRICHTAWNQAAGVANAGAELTVLCGSLSRDLPAAVKIHQSLAWAGLKLPYRLLGRYRTLQLHDWLTARWLRKHRHEFDLVHCWPAAALRTIKAARECGIPSLLERPNAHTAYAFESTIDETRRLGFELPSQHDHAYDQVLLDHEESEYEQCDFLLTPSEFVTKTFLERGADPTKLLSHHYGYDGERFSPKVNREPTAGLKVLYVGACEPRKGLHYALEAWQKSEGSQTGTFQICGEFVPGYAEYLELSLAHPSVTTLGQRSDIADIMQSCDILVLSSIEEGSALVTYEAMASGCVLLVSEGSGAHCQHGHDALVHPIRDVETLTQHFNQLHHDRELLAALREKSLAKIPQFTWAAAGKKLLSVYREAIAQRQKSGVS